MTLARTTHDAADAPETSWADDDALRVLVRDYYDRVYRFGRGACRDAFDADDAVQEAFIKLARRPDVQRDQGALSWLMSVVRNACLRMMRAFGRSHSAPWASVEDSAAAAEGGPDAALERFRVVDQVHRAIAALSPEHRQVILLRDLEGLSGEEAAERLGIAETAMKTRLHRARRLLRERIERQ